MYEFRKITDVSVKQLMPWYETVHSCITTQRGCTLSNSNAIYKSEKTQGGDMYTVVVSGYERHRNCNRSSEKKL